MDEPPSTASRRIPFGGESSSSRADQQSPNATMTRAVGLRSRPSRWAVNCWLGLRPLSRPKTLLGWHRMLIAGEYDGSASRMPGLPGTVAEVETLVVRVAEENRDWGYSADCLRSSTALPEQDCNSADCGFCERKHTSYSRLFQHHGSVSIRGVYSESHSITADSKAVVAVLHVSLTQTVECVRRCGMLHRIQPENLCGIA
jgi:hypothetical protein